MIPLAIIGWQHPLLAGAAVAVSATTVVTNANLLRRVDVQPDRDLSTSGAKPEER